MEQESIEGKSRSIEIFLAISPRTSGDVMGQLTELPKNAAALYTQLTKQIGKLQDTQCRKYVISLDYKFKLLAA